MNEWIDVEDRLPEYETEVIAAILDSNGVIEVADRAWFHKGEEHTELEDMGDGIHVEFEYEPEPDVWASNYCIIEEPTHWMPLPEPPSK